MLDYFKLSYLETVEKVKKYCPDLIPETKGITKKELYKLLDTADYCAKFYYPEPGDIPVEGLFLFRQCEQPKENQDTNGINIWWEEGGKKHCVIGISIEIIDNEPDNFINYVFIHEIAHVDGKANGHDDAFQYRLNSMIWDYFIDIDGERYDSVGTSPRKKHVF
ncbi:MAG: SprT-like domain-containing protein [Oscillospiraceae bacterium]|nr:SprT-like domain-containing protein [Oscillospiraceae bacterium]